MSNVNRLALRLTLILLVGGVLDILIVGSLITLTSFILIYGFEAPPLFFKQMTKPFEVISMLFTGGSTSVGEKAHTIFMELPLHGFFWLIYLLFCSKFAFQTNGVSKVKEAHDYGSHGTATWQKKDEIKKYYLQDEVGFIMGEYHEKKGKSEVMKHLCIHPIKSQLNQNIVVIGPPGSNKTTGYVVPNILRNAERVGESLVLSDPKGELYNITSQYLKQFGYDVFVFNLLDPKRSMRYNPFDYISNTQDVASIAHMITKTGKIDGSGDNIFFENAEFLYTTMLIHYLREFRPEEEQHLRSVLRLGSILGHNDERLEKVFSDLPPDSNAKIYYDMFMNARDKTLSNIIITFAATLQLWADPNIAHLMSTSDFDLSQIGQKKTALYILSPDDDPTFNTITTMLIEQCYRQLVKQAGRTPGGKLKVPVRFILDEVANIAKIYNFQKKVSSARGRGISFVPIYQGIAQMREEYNENQSEAILGTMDSIIILGANDKITAKYVSDKLDTTTIGVESISENKNEHGGSSGKSQNFTGRSLMTPGEVERMDRTELICFQSGRNPVKLKKHPFYEQQRWKHLVVEKEVIDKDTGGTIKTFVPVTNWFEDIPKREDEELQIPNLDFKEKHIHYNPRPKGSSISNYTKTKLKRKPKGSVSVATEEKPKKGLFTKKPNKKDGEWFPI